MSNLKIRYAAIVGRKPLVTIIKDKKHYNKVLLDLIEIYGLDFIGLYENKQEAEEQLALNDKIFGNCPSLDFDKIDYLERCFKLEV